MLKDAETWGPPELWRRREGKRQRRGGGSGGDRGVGAGDERARARERVRVRALSKLTKRGVCWSGEENSCRLCLLAARLAGYAACHPSFMQACILNLPSPPQPVRTFLAHMRATTLAEC